MKALITGASSGIGYEIADYLSEKGYELIVVARRKEKLIELEKKLNKKITIIDLDLSIEENCYKLYEMTKNEDVDILINNAGFGIYGNFFETNLAKEIDMIKLNIKVPHILTKLYLKDMKKKNKGYIMNVASMAAFSPGPLMAAYYATKSYVLSLTQSIYYELKKDNSNISISCLCPGPVKTEFNKNAKIKYGYKPLSSAYVAKYGIDKMFNRKLIIIPSLTMKFLRQLSKIIPDKFMMKIIYKNQLKKQE